MEHKGAGGTEGGITQFIVGLIMLIAGGYLFLDAVHIRNYFGFGRSLFSIGGVDVPGGYILIPLVFGFGMIFFNAKNILGWLLLLASLVMIIFGIITSVDLQIREMTAFEMIIILALLAGGFGLFLRSLQSFK